MATLTIRFYEELNDFLPRDKRKKSYGVFFEGKVGVKHIIESEGVPHSEVDLILVNGKSVDFSYPVGDNDYISVYPVFESLDISPLYHLREKPLRVSRFIADVHLGKLARYLRLLGFDTLYQNDYDDPLIVDIAFSQKRIILTRDRELLKRKKVTRGYWLRSLDTREQLEEVITRFDLTGSFCPLNRCMMCNGKLEAASAEDIVSQTDEWIRSSYSEFFKCPVCGKIYWKGYHYKGLEAILKKAGWTDS